MESSRHQHWEAARAFLWAFVGAVVLLFVFFVALGGIDPTEAKVATVMVAVLALAWLAHSWRRLTSKDTGHISHGDRERRGY